MILAKQQWNNRNHALNPSKLLSSQLLPNTCFTVHFQLFCQGHRQAVLQVGWVFIQSPSQEVFNYQLGKALRSLVWPQSWPCFEQKTRAQNLLRLLPDWIILLSYAVYADFSSIWVLFFCSKFIRCLFPAGIFPPLCPTFYLELWQLATHSASLSPFTGLIISNSNSHHIWMWNLIQIWIGLSERD